MDEIKDCDETKRLYLILKNAWKLAFDIAVRTMTIKEAQEEAWMKVAGSVKLMIKNHRPKANIEKVLAEMKKRYDDDDGTLTFNDRNFMDDVDIEKVIAFIRKAREGKNGTNP